MAKKVKRLIFYYSITTPGIDAVKYLTECFEGIHQENKARSSRRYLYSSGGNLCMWDIVFAPSRNFIKGQILRIRMDDWPEKFNVEEALLEELTGEESEGIAEKTHFILDMNFPEPILGIEYNKYGPKMHDLARYLTFIDQRLRHVDDLHSIENRMIVRNDIDRYIKKMGTCYSIQAKVHRDDIERVEGATGLGSAFAAARDFGNPEFYEIVMSFDGRKRSDKEGFTKAIGNLLSRIRIEPKNLEPFDKLKITAANTENQSKKEIFDLVSMRVKSQVDVEQREKSRTVVSLQMLELLERELRAKFPR